MEGEAAFRAVEKSPMGRTRCVRAVAADLRKPQSVARAGGEFGVAAAISATCLYYFGTFAFANPESEVCLAAPNSSRASDVPINRGTGREDGEEEDMAVEFRTWFFFGVLFYGAFFAFRMLMFAGALAKSIGAVALAHVLSITLFLASVLWTG